jgi:cobaltochelatase CobN
MHLLATRPGGFVLDAAGIVRIEQDPADIVVLSATDTSLALLAQACARLPDDFPSVRLCNLLHLRQAASIDLYIDEVLRHARIVVVDHLGGEAYWPYGTECLATLARERGQVLLMFSGDHAEDPNLTRRSTATPAQCRELWRYLRDSGPDNALQFFHFLGANFFARAEQPLPPQPLPQFAIYDPQSGIGSIEAWQSRWLPNAPVVALVFYRAHLQSGNTAVFDAMLEALQSQQLNPLPIALSSLKDADCLQQLRQLCAAHDAALILNSTAFCLATLDDPGATSQPLAGSAPVLQLILSGGNREDWEQDNQGLQPRDIAMQVALPEIDGRIIARAISFKGLAWRCPRTQVDVVRYQPDRERIAFVAELSRRWCRLQQLPADEKRIGLILANYPTRDGRIGNGVGLDTPASVVGILHLLATRGYRVDAIPADGDALLDALLGGVTNDLDAQASRPAHQSLALAAYKDFLATLPEANRSALLARWGEPELDPMLRADPRSGQQRFMIAGIRSGNIFIGIQPPRAFSGLHNNEQFDPYAIYHNPDLVPPHYYLAFYFWLRETFACDAIVHVGKHGNLEWLPGKSVALSAECWPDLILGPLPHLYPFIVNDPGEGSQAKRRAQAVIVDHLMPPLTRAENYGPLQDLERQVDEYYEALMIDQRRAKILRRDILDLIVDRNLHRDLGLDIPADPVAEEILLTRTDAYLCEVKESQIRAGLHVFGESPSGVQLRDTLLALARFPVGDGAGANAGLLTALARDLQLRGADGEWFDPLDADWAAPWNGARPAPLLAISTEPWRHCGDTRERLEIFATKIIALTIEWHEPDNGAVPFLSGTFKANARDHSHCDKEARVPERKGIAPSAPCTGLLKDSSATAMSILEPAHRWPQTSQVLARIETQLLPALNACGAAERQGLCDGLDGLFVPPGPSGAPSRGRPDVLPTGRNFYSVDTRAVPTATAWRLGFKSAALLVERYLQEHGDYPRTLGLSVWGTATMRTGGDDIAQAFALLGVRPKWAAGSHRVADFEILPMSILDRPRIDVTLRVSGFFRDAFANVMQLFDAAVQAVAELDEPADVNPLRQHVLRDTALLQAQGLDLESARAQAGWRIFGAAPGAYGAGLQALIDESLWQDDADLAHAFRDWGGYAYGRQHYGVAAATRFGERLSALQLVVQNQDNREHDLLDSSDYAQFQGGMSAAVRHFSGAQPAIYHGDHSNPQAPRVRSLQEEISRVIRARVVNPKWLEGIRRHGYKGAFEIAATVDYLFAFDATARVVGDHQYELVADAYINDATTRDFLHRHNPAALRDICERLLEAMQRGLWQQPGAYRAQLENHLLDNEQLLERSRS